MDFNLPDPLPVSSSTSAIPRLEPLPFGRVIALTSAIYRARFSTYFLPMLLLNVPVAIITSLLSGSLLDKSQSLSAESQLLSQSGRSAATLSQAQIDQISADLIKLLSVLIVIVAVGAILQLIRLLLVDTTLVYITSEKILGRQPTFRQGFQAVRARWGTVAFGQIAFYALLIGLTIALSFTLFLCGLGIGLLVYVGLVLGPLLTPVLVLERDNAFRGINHAWGLGKGRFWALVALTAMALLLSGVAVLVTGAINTALSNLFMVSDTLTGSTPTLSLVALMIGGLVSGVGTSLIAPFSLIGYTVLYYDARVRLEGFGEALTALHDPEARPADIQPPTGLTLGALKGSDFVNILLTMVATIVVVLIYSAISFSLSAASLR